jgi:tight adherence protein B
MFVFVAFLLFSGALFGVAYYVWVVPRQEAARSLDARLRGVRSTVSGAKERGVHDLMRSAQARSMFAFLGDFVDWLGVVRRLQVYINQANLTYRAADVVGICLAIALILYVILDFIIPIFLLRLLAALLIGSAPIAWIVHKRTSRLGRFEADLPDAIDLFTRTMRAGHNIHSGLETVAAETSDPVRMEFRKMMEELALGSQIEPALHNLGERIPLIDLKFFVTGLILQRQTGANMAGVLENLSVLVRERLKMAAKMKAHTAQQRYSAGLLCGLPFVVGLGSWFLKPDYLRLLWTDPTGIKFFTYAIVSECVGILVIRKMANIKF